MTLYSRGRREETPRRTPGRALNLGFSRLITISHVLDADSYIRINTLRRYWGPVMAHPTGVSKGRVLGLDSDSRLKLEFHGSKAVAQGRYTTFQLAEVAVPRDLFRKIRRLIDDLRRIPAPA